MAEQVTEEAKTDQQVGDLEVTAKQATSEEENKQDQDGTTLKTVVVAGATGAVGRHCVNVLVRDSRVGKVVALVRCSEKPPEFYELDSKTDDLGKLEHITVDYDGDLDKQLADHTFDAGISCIGVYPSSIKTLEEYLAKEHAPNMKIAEAASKHGCTRWAYLSGSASKQTQTLEPKQSLLSYIKGKVEVDLQQYFSFVAASQSMLIVGRPDAGGAEKFFNKLAGKKFAKTKFGVHRNDIYTAMVSAILSEKLQQSFYGMDNEKLKEEAKKYRGEM